MLWHRHPLAPVCPPPSASPSPRLTLGLHLRWLGAKPRRLARNWGGTYPPSRRRRRQTPCSVWEVLKTHHLRELLDQKKLFSCIFLVGTILQCCLFQIKGQYPLPLVQRMEKLQSLVPFKNNLTQAIHSWERRPSSVDRAGQDGSKLRERRLRGRHEVRDIKYTEEATNGITVIFLKKNTNLRWHDGSDFVFDSAFMNRIGFDDGAVSSTVFFCELKSFFWTLIVGAQLPNTGRGLNDRSFHGKIKTSKGCIY